MSLENKKIIIGITGGIAAYKINYLVRDFVKAGAEVRIVMTKPTEDFVSPLTLSTLSRNKVYTDFHTDFTSNGYDKPTTEKREEPP